MSLDNVAKSQEVTGYVMWPEDNPEKARFMRNDQWIMDFWWSLGWSLSGQRTSRTRPVKSTDNPVVIARNCNRVRSKHT